MDKLQNKFKWIAIIIIMVFVCEVPTIAAEYPTNPITFIIPITPGGSVDLSARALANAAKKYLGQPFLFENKTGGGGTVGATLALSKPPDGYTIGNMAISSIITSYHMGKLSFDPTSDPTYIMSYTTALYGIVVRADAPWKTIQEFIQHSKANPNKVSYGTAGVGTIGHLYMEELSYLAGGIKWIHVPYRGAAEWIPALLGGHVEAGSQTSAWAPLVDAGKLRLLTIPEAERLSRYPDVPTLKEVGYDIVYSNPYVIFGPKGLPKPIVKRLHDAFKKAFDDPEFQSVLAKLDMKVFYLSPEESERFVRQDSEKIGKVVQRIGLKKK